MGVYVCVCACVHVPIHSALLVPSLPSSLPTQCTVPCYDLVKTGKAVTQSLPSTSLLKSGLYSLGKRMNLYLFPNGLRLQNVIPISLQHTHTSLKSSHTSLKPPTHPLEPPPTHLLEPPPHTSLNPPPTHLLETPHTRP